MKTERLNLLAVLIIAPLALLEQHVNAQTNPVVGIPDGAGGAASVGGAAAIGGSGLGNVSILSGGLAGGATPVRSLDLGSTFVTQAVAASATQSLEEMEDEFSETEVTTNYAGNYLDIYFSPTDEATAKEARNIIEGEYKKLVDKAADEIKAAVTAAPPPAAGITDAFYTESLEEIETKRGSLNSEIEQVRSQGHVEAHRIATTLNSSDEEIRQSTYIRAQAGNVLQGLSGFQAMPQQRAASLREYDTMFHSLFQHPQTGNAFQQAKDIANGKRGFEDK